jgi:hypothetical protein
MKKILIILFIIISFPIFGQGYKELSVASIIGSDTTLYLVNGKHNLLTIDFTTVNSSASTLDVGLTDDNICFVSVDVSGLTFPVTLSKSTYTKTANTYTRNRIEFKSSNWPGTYIAIKITKVSATSGTYKITY